VMASGRSGGQRRLGARREALVLGKGAEIAAGEPRLNTFGVGPCVLEGLRHLTGLKCRIF
jgi:hypothetical protein